MPKKPPGVAFLLSYSRRMSLDRSKCLRILSDRWRNRTPATDGEGAYPSLSVTSTQPLVFATAYRVIGVRSARHSWLPLVPEDLFPKLTFLGLDRYVNRHGAIFVRFER
jgi:hypothetical protein